MTFRIELRRYLPPTGLAAAMIALAGCQAGGEGGLFNLGGARQQAAEQERIDQSELLAYCPKVTLRQGTAYFNTYAKAPPGEPQEDRSRIIYQASIGEVTRTCNYGGGQLSMTVAVAGRVVPGPKAQTGSITLPLRVAVMRGSEVLYSKLHKYPVTISSVAGASQYVFSDPAVTVPAPTAANLQVYVGFDEGPYDTP